MYYRTEQQKRGAAFLQKHNIGGLLVSVSEAVESVWPVRDANIRLPPQPQRTARKVFDRNFFNGKEVSECSHLRIVHRYADR